jgi:CheY-like chemotaxis protein
MRPVIWLVGDCSDPDSTDAVAWMQVNCDCRDPQTARADSPSAIVVLQSRPAADAARDVELLHRQAPLARLVTLTGPWSDGELRTGRLPAGVVRIRWHQWRQQLPAELTSRSARLPRTATDAERLDRQISALATTAKAGGRVAIRTSSRNAYRVLADACQSLGWRAAESELSAACDLQLIDGWAELRELSANTDAQVPPRILLIDFPRPDDLRRAAEIGIRAVISKPFTLPVLTAALAEAAPRDAGSAVHTSVA